MHETSLGIGGPMRDNLDRVICRLSQAILLFLLGTCGNQNSLTEHMYAKMLIIFSQVCFPWVGLVLVAGYLTPTSNYSG